MCQNKGELEPHVNVNGRQLDVIIELQMIERTHKHTQTIVVQSGEKDLIKHLL